MELKDTIAQGAALLDQFAPVNWRERVNVETLDMNDTTACVASQAFGKSWAWLPDDIRYHDAFGGDGDQLEALRVAWVAYLTDASVTA